MTSFDFWLIGAAQPQRLDVDAGHLEEIAAAMGQCRFIVGEVACDDTGEIRRLMISSNRVQAVLEVT